MPILSPGIGSAGAFLPETENVGGGVTERRHTQGSFGIGRLDDLATLRLDMLDGVVDAVDVDVGQQTWLARDRLIGYPRAADVSGPVIETRMVGVAPVYLPAKDLLVEGGRLMDVDCGYVQVGEAPMSSEASLYTRGGGRLCLLVVVVVHGCLLSHA